MILLALAATLVQVTTQFDARLGLVVLAPNGGGCLVISDQSLRPGADSVAFVRLNERTSRSYSAIVERKIPDCEGLKGIAGAHYELRLWTPERAGPGVYGGVVGGAGIIVQPSGEIVFHLLRTSVMFRGCNSPDGTHVSAWSGTPPQGKKLWRRAVQRQSDVLPPCTEADLRDPGPNELRILVARKPRQNPGLD